MSLSVDNGWVHLQRIVGSCFKDIIIKLFASIMTKVQNHLSFNYKCQRIFQPYQPENSNRAKNSSQCISEHNIKKVFFTTTPVLGTINDILHWVCHPECKPAKNKRFLDVRRLHYSRTLMYTTNLNPNKVSK